MMSGSCVFCSATRVDVDMEDVWGSEKVAGALSRICSLNLVAPPLVFEPGSGMRVCTTCRPTINGVIESLRREEHFLTQLANLNVQIVGGVEALGRRVLVGTASPNPSHADYVWKEYRRQVIRNYVTGKLPNPSVHLVPLDPPPAHSGEDDDSDDDAAANLLTNQNSRVEAEEVVLRAMRSDPLLPDEEEEEEEEMQSTRKKESLGRIRYLLLDNKVESALPAQNLAYDFDKDNFNDRDDGSSVSTGSSDSDLDNIFEVKRIVRRKKSKTDAKKDEDKSPKAETSKVAATVDRPIRPGFGRLSRGRGKASHRPTRTESPAIERLTTPSPPPLKRTIPNQRGRGGKRGRGRRGGAANQGSRRVEAVARSDHAEEEEDSSEEEMSAIMGGFVTPKRAIPPQSKITTVSTPVIQKRLSSRKSPPLVPPSPPAPLNRPPRGRGRPRGKKRTFLENLQTKSPTAESEIENESPTENDNSAADTIVPSSPPAKKKKRKTLPVMDKKRYSGPYTPHYGTLDTPAAPSPPPPMRTLFTCPVDKCGESFANLDPLLTSHFFTYHIILAAKVSKKEHAFKCKLCLEKDFFVKVNLPEIREANLDDVAGKEMAKHYLEEHQVGFKTLPGTEATTGVKSTAKKTKAKPPVRKATKRPVEVPVPTVSPSTSEQENVPKRKGKKKKAETVTKKLAKKKKSALTPSKQDGDEDEEEEEEEMTVPHESRSVVKKRNVAAPKRKVGRKKKDLKKKPSEQKSNSDVIDDNEEEKDPDSGQSIEIVDSQIMTNEEPPREEEREVVFNEEDENLTAETAQPKPLVKPRPKSEQDLNSGSSISTPRRKPGPKSKTTHRQKSPSPLLVMEERAEEVQTTALIPSSPSLESLKSLQNENQQENRDDEENGDQTDAAVKATNNEQADDETADTPAADDEGVNDDDDDDDYDNLFLEKIENDRKRDSSVLTSDEEGEDDGGDGGDDDNDDINRQIMIEMSRMFASKVASDPSKPWSVTVPLPETQTAGPSSTSAAPPARTEEEVVTGSPGREGTSDGSAEGGFVGREESGSPEQEGTSAEGPGAESAGDDDMEGEEDSFKDAESGGLPSTMMFTTSFIEMAQLGDVILGSDDGEDDEDE
ncbi:neurofilament heavy polypeptide [Folsomia candida]|uniref:neurofilament heavy polypeptide n=1 Tax=Folsomia candida TaxID=158441 RepID=UPI000B8F242B|nr:neurofilament heavy polypeptide [Folsomia candida]